MAIDRAPSAFLGRPCYHGAGGCSIVDWSVGRYSERVVASLAAAMPQLVGVGCPLVLIGHSGGGTLAMLLAERLPEVVAVATVAGNLDTEAWTELHGFEPLSESLNPARRPPLPGRVRQLHLVGGRDRIVPATLPRPGPPAAAIHVVERASHEEGWAEVWPDVLEWLEGSGE